MKTTLKRVLSGLAAAAIGATMVPLLTAPVAGAAGVPQSGGATVSPTSGTSATNFNVSLPSGAACTGDSANDGYRVQSYMVPGSVDPGTLTFGAGGPVRPTGATGLYEPLYTTTGSPYVNAQTANATVAGGPGPIINIPTFNYQVFRPGEIPPGTYHIGIACTLGPAGPDQMKEYWNTTLTFTTNSGDGAANASWTVGAVPAAPVLSSATPGDRSITAAFTHSASTPPTTSYTVTATPAAGGTAVTANGTASPITVAGLTNGTAYNVTVTATNSAGTSPASNSLTATPAQPAHPAVGNLSVTPGSPGSGTANATWTAPASGPAPSGYRVVVDPATGVTVSHTGTATSAALSGLTANTQYTLTVTATYANAQDVGTPASQRFAVLPAAVVQQQLTVTVPEGALTITQECGRGPDNCEVAFGTASLITTGPNAGKFYAARAELRQLTVTDTRAQDPGWTATGTMSDFQRNTASFKGDQLGWTPRAVGAGGYTSPTRTYTQSITAGAPVAPNTANGLGAGATLARGAPAGGLGRTALDAQLDLLIPVGMADGAYAGTLTLTAT